MPHPSQPTIDEEDPDAVSLNLGDNFHEEIHNHIYPTNPSSVSNTTTTTTETAGAGSGTTGGGTVGTGNGGTGPGNTSGTSGPTGTPPGTGSVLVGTVGGIGSNLAPWVAAIMAAPLGAALVGWYLSSTRPPAPVATSDVVNVQDVQSAFQVEVFDEDGNRLEYVYSPQRPKPPVIPKSVLPESNEAPPFVPPPQ